MLPLLPHTERAYAALYRVCNALITRRLRASFVARLPLVCSVACLSAACLLLAFLWLADCLRPSFLLCCLSYLHAACVLSACLMAGRMLAARLSLVPEGCLLDASLFCGWPLACGELYLKSAYILLAACSPLASLLLADPLFHMSASYLLASCMLYGWPLDCGAALSYACVHLACCLLTLG